jgi:hypothetical protein
MRKNKIVKILYLVLIVGVIIGFIIFTRSKSPAQKPGSVLSPISTSTEYRITPTSTESQTTTELYTQTTTTSQSQIDTSDWEIYRNEEFGFGFRYPKEYKVWTDYDPQARIPKLLGGIVFIGNNVQLDFNPRILAKKTLEQSLNYIDGSTMEKLISKERTYIGGEEAIKVKFADGERIYFRGKSKKENYLYPDSEWKYTWLYIFSFCEKEAQYLKNKGVEKVPKEVFEQIVASFEFIE